MGCKCLRFFITKEKKLGNRKLEKTVPKNPHQTMKTHKILISFFVSICFSLQYSVDKIVSSSGENLMMYIVIAIIIC